jgi:hypothetical protein
MKTSNQSRPYLAFRLLRPSLGLVLTLLGILLLIWTTSPISTAREKLDTNTGTVLCMQWCDKHNKTDKSRELCHKNCIDYWLKHGSDAPASNAVGPNSTPTPSPRKYPIKGPPRKLGPTSSPTPSATAKPILLAQPKPTPSPKPTPKKSDHGHH